MKKIYSVIDKLIIYAKENLGLADRNEIYVRNGIFSLLGLKGENAQTADGLCENIDTLEREFITAGTEDNIFSETDGERYFDIVMGELSLDPKSVEDNFYAIMKDKGAKAAADYLYDYSIKNGYIKKSKLDKNPRFDSNGLIITINNAKPEFSDPKKAVEGNSAGGYPKCTICRENEGYEGRSKRTLRTVSLTLNGEKWFWQYSPYGYFYQHGIAVNTEHIPMHVDKNTFMRLMDFVDIFPHYFIGCNAALPRIGGSVLAHDHYQGGGEILPMHKAPVYKVFKLKGYNGLVEILDWANTAVRVVSADKKEIADISDIIRLAWENYFDPRLGIINKDEEGVHSGISPTVIKTERGYEMNIILRNNITSEKYPDGVFHAHGEYHVIKKESIGLIEAQGLFILPSRLSRQLKSLKENIVKGVPPEGEMKDFDWIYKEAVSRLKAFLNESGGNVNVGADFVLKGMLGEICGKILENTAVFKDKSQTVKFLKDIGFTEA